MKKLRYIFLGGGLSLLLILILSNFLVIFIGLGHIKENIEEVTPYDVALVLGTSKNLQSGKANPFFQQRIEAAYELYKIRKVKHFILSGDNREKYYNEPQDMKDALIEKGVPASSITLDFAGLRTLDSVVRSKEIFGQDSIIVVTQKFHGFRAYFLCRSHGITAEVYGAGSVPVFQALKVYIRELFARSGAIFDVYLLNRSPKHLGEKIDIKIS